MVCSNSTMHAASAELTTQHTVCSLSSLQTKAPTMSAHLRPSILRHPVVIGSVRAGEGNDYVGKGMAGGTITVVPPPDVGFAPEDASVVGNTCLYGATGGRLFVHGRAGERFAVRNSLAEAVCEGTGDHACEYMTGGCVVVLGTVGRNVGAGMTGGLGYFYDADGQFTDKVNAEIVQIQRVCSDAGEAQLKELLQEHARRTGSVTAQRILDEWTTELAKFWQLVPPSEKDTAEATPDVRTHVVRLPVCRLGFAGEAGLLAVID